MSRSMPPNRANDWVLRRTRQSPLRVTPPKIAMCRSGSSVAWAGVDGRRPRGRRRRGRGDHDQVGGDRDQVVEGLGLQQLVEPLVVLVLGQPALGVRGAQQGGDMVPVGVRRAQVATGDGADVGGFGEAVGHDFTLARPAYAGARAGCPDSGVPAGGFGATLTRSSRYGLTPSCSLRASRSRSPHPSSSRAQCESRRSSDCRLRVRDADVEDVALRVGQGGPAGAVLVEVADPGRAEARPPAPPRPAGRG